MIWYIKILKTDNTYCPVLVILVIFKQECIKRMLSSNWNMQEGRKGSFSKGSLDLPKSCKSCCIGVRIKTRYYWYLVLTLVAPVIFLTHQLKYFIAIMKPFGGSRPLLDQVQTFLLGIRGSWGSAIFFPYLPLIHIWTRHAEPQTVP